MTTSNLLAGGAWAVSRAMQRDPITLTVSDGSVGSQVTLQDGECRELIRALLDALSLPYAKAGLPTETTEEMRERVRRWNAEAGS